MITIDYYVQPCITLYINKFSFCNNIYIVFWWLSHTLLYLCVQDIINYQNVFISLSFVVSCFCYLIIIFVSPALYAVHCACAITTRKWLRTKAGWSAPLCRESSAAVLSWHWATYLASYARLRVLKTATEKNLCIDTCASTRASLVFLGNPTLSLITHPWADSNG